MSNPHRAYYRVLVTELAKLILMELRKSGEVTIALWVPDKVGFFGHNWQQDFRGIFKILGAGQMTFNVTFPLDVRKSYIRGMEWKTWKKQSSLLKKKK